MTPNPSLSTTARATGPREGLTPLRLTCWTWVAYFAFCLCLSPIAYHRPISGTTVCFISLCLMALGYGSYLGQKRPMEGRRLTASITPALHDGKLNRSHAMERITQICALLGLLGACLIIFDKVIIGGVDISAGLGSLRMEQELGANMATQRSSLLLIGMAIYSFANVALILYVLAGDGASKRTGMLVSCAAFSPAVVVLLYGGRSSAVLLMFHFFCAGLLRKKSGRSFLPQAPYMRTLWLTYSTLVVVGGLYVFTSRADARGYDGNSELVYNFTEDANASIPAELQEFIDGRSMLGNIASNLIMSAGYITQGIPELDYLLVENSDAGPYWGQYQGWFVARAVNVVLRLPDSSDRLEYEIHRKGVFCTALGAMYLDFHWWSILAFFLLGIIGGRLYHFGVRRGSVAQQLLLVHLYMFLLTSPVHSAIGAGNSMQAFCAMCATAWFIAYEKKRTEPHRKRTQLLSNSLKVTKHSLHTNQG